MGGGAEAKPYGKASGLPRARSSPFPKTPGAANPPRPGFIPTNSTSPRLTRGSPGRLFSLWGERAARGGTAAGPVTPPSPSPRGSETLYLRWIGEFYRAPGGRRVAVAAVIAAMSPRCRRAPPGPPLPPPLPCPRCPAQRWRPALAQPQRTRRQNGGRKWLHPPDGKGGGERGRVFDVFFDSPALQKHLKDLKAFRCEASRVGFFTLPCGRRV